MLYQGLIIGKGQLSWQSLSHSALGKGEVKLKIMSAGLNRADLSQIAGTYMPPQGASPVLGLECSGRIVEIGDGVDSWKVGDPVCALLAGGGLATEVICDQRQLLSVPAGLSISVAGGIVETFATAWMNLFMLAEARAGERALIMAGGSGVGVAALQLCRLFNIQAAVVVGEASKLELCKSLGAIGGINRKTDDWKALKDYGPFNIVLDCCGGDWLEKQMTLMAEEGRLVNIGLLAGRRGEIDVGKLLMKRLKIMGSTLRFLSIERKQQVLNALTENVWPLIASGEVKSVIDSYYDISEFEQAYARLKSNQTTGKVIMNLPV